MAAEVCTPSALVADGATLAPFSYARQKAILIYVLTKYLNALGGTNYSGNFEQLIIDAANWPTMNPAQRSAALTEILIATANVHGAGISTDKTTLVAAANYLENAPNQDSLLLFLACALGAKL